MTTDVSPQGPGGGVTSAKLDEVLGSTDGLYAKRVAGAWTQAAAGGGPNTVSSGYVSDPIVSQVTVPYAASPTYTTVGTYDVGVVDGDQIVPFSITFGVSSVPGQAVGECLLEYSLDNGGSWQVAHKDGGLGTNGIGYAESVSYSVAVEASDGDHVKFRLRAWCYYGASDSLSFTPAADGKDWFAVSTQ